MLLQMLLLIWGFLSFASSMLRKWPHVGCVPSLRRSLCATSCWEVWLWEGNNLYELLNNSIGCEVGIQSVQKQIWPWVLTFALIFRSILPLIWITSQMSICLILEFIKMAWRDNIGVSAAFIYITDKCLNLGLHSKKSPLNSPVHAPRGMPHMLHTCYATHFITKKMWSLIWTDGNFFVMSFSLLHWVYLLLLSSKHHTSRCSLFWHSDTLRHCALT